MNNCFCDIRSRVIYTIGVLLLLVFFWLLPVVAEVTDKTDAIELRNTSYDLTQLSIEDLMNVEVEITLASRKPERLFDTTSATYVISHEDIQRSGITNIPDLLRMVPGMQVDNINSNSRTVTCRGLGNRFGNKLLVLFDGRSVYATTLGGVWWDVQDTTLMDIERIEIIRGPGATMWGANAVNGVINIISRHSEATQGSAISQTIGSQDKSNTEVRYGGRLDENGTYRIFGKNFNRGGSITQSGAKAHDSWYHNRSGFRVDLNPSTNDSVAIQGQAYQGRYGTTDEALTLSPPYIRIVEDMGNVTGGDLQAEWTHRISQKSSTNLLFYCDKSEHKDWRIDDSNESWNIDFSHRFSVGDRHDIVWGIGYRTVDGTAKDGVLLNFNPDNHTDQLYSAFLQDDIVIKKDKFKLTLGSKFEHNTYTGIELQPSARVLWTPDKQHAIWAAVSRAVRTPSWLERYGQINVNAVPGPMGLPLVSALIGDPDFDSERLTAYETGYRVQTNNHLQFDVAAFYNVYDGVQAGVAHPENIYPVGSPPQYLILPITFVNGGRLRSYGAELAVTWKPAQWWRVSGWYTSLHVNSERGLPSSDSSIAMYDRAYPRSQFHIRSYMDLPNNLSFDALLYYDGSKSTGNAFTTLPNISSYTRLDLRLGWTPKPNQEFSIGIQNALDSRHVEYTTRISELPTLVERTFYARAVWSTL